MNARIFDSVDDVAAGAAATLVRAINGRERVAVGISGGSAPLPLYRLLAGEAYREQLRAAQITWVLVDERFVPRDDPQSNARSMHETLFANGLPEQHRFLAFDTSLATPEESAAAFEAEWRALGLEMLDAVILGCGADGHTASLFPGSPVLAIDDRVAAAVYAEHLAQWRVTLTMPVLRAAALRMVIATGESKRDVIARVRAGEDLPVAQATKELDSWWFVDRPAWI